MSPDIAGTRAPGVPIDPSPIRIGFYLSAKRSSSRQRPTFDRVRARRANLARATDEIVYP
jgi:hypothetical protein